MAHTQDLWDCLIVGGGPAGLTAALYLARYRRRVLVLDAGRSRAAQIPETHNHPGYKGIAGKALLSLLREQACQYGAVIRTDEVGSLRTDERMFEADGGERYRACRVLSGDRAY
jgi:thioredoxin reductase (NADPH)